MQTFLPLPDFQASAMHLDRLRLGKQRVEAKQIYLALTVVDYGWKNHPATKMWRGCEVALCLYGYHICQEWIRRGYKDSLSPFFEERLRLPKHYPLPEWLGDEAFHAAHRSKLAQKLPEWYTVKFGWQDLGLEYVWPEGKVA